MTIFKIPLRNKTGEIVEYELVDQEIYDKIKDLK